MQRLLPQQSRSTFFYQSKGFLKSGNTECDKSSVWYIQQSDQSANLLAACDNSLCSNTTIKILNFLFPKVDGCDTLE